MNKLEEFVNLVQAMREALVRCATLGEYCFQDIHAEVAKVARAALATPARNCDVGTAQDQHERWKEFCNRNWSSANAAAGLDPCDDCRFVDCDTNGGSSGCQFAWAQMPYEKEGGAE